MHWMKGKFVGFVSLRITVVYSSYQYNHTDKKDLLLLVDFIKMSCRQSPQCTHRTSDLSSAEGGRHAPQKGKILPHFFLEHCSFVSQNGFYVMVKGLTNALFLHLLSLPLLDIYFLFAIILFHLAYF